MGTGFASGLTALGIALTMTTISSDAAGQDRQPNHLLGARSPYLQQHLYNAVDWYPWGPQALQKARNEDKPVFLSIGYSTCHWCHVMSAESFEDGEIGAFLNDHFVSIKIDRERRPDLDEQFMLVTQIIAGNGGWPNSVFLTPHGDPFYAGTYFPPATFLDLLQQIDGFWKTRRTDIEAEGQRIGTAVRNYLTRSAPSRDMTPEAVGKAANSLLAGVDPFNGGLGGAPKFPRESTLLFLLDQAERRGERPLLKTVTGALDGMLMGGIHDHAGGGFHRYSVDARWHVPHFEKMLYNQALIGRLLIRAWKATGLYRYRRAAIRTLDYVLRDMRTASGGFYSAQDADSPGPDGQEGEGHFYVWRADELRRVLGDDTDFAIGAFGVTAAGNFEGANVLHMTKLPDHSTTASETGFYDRLDPVLEKLRLARMARPAPHTDKKIVVDWNAMMIVTLAEAAEVFSRPDYYQAAAAAARFISGDMMTGGQLKRISFEGKTGVDAQLSDYAGLGLALLALHDFAPSSENSPDYLDEAGNLAAELTRRFAGKNDQGGVYRMTATPEGLGTVLPIDDNEIPAGNALALALLDGLGKRTGDPSYARQATLLTAALSGHALTSPSSRGSTLKAALALSHGGAGIVRHVANGSVRIRTYIDHERQTLKLRIAIKDGWHINANVPHEDYFISTELSISGTPANAGIYPEPLVKSLDFNDRPLALYEGTIELNAPLPVIGRDQPPGQAVLKLQACNDQICLAPEELNFTLW